MMAEGKRIASEGVEGGGGKTGRDRRARRKAIRERRSGERTRRVGVRDRCVNLERGWGWGWRRSLWPGMSSDNTPARTWLSRLGS